MTRSDLIAHLESRGVLKAERAKDSWDWRPATRPDDVYRFRITRAHCTYFTRCNHGDGTWSWVRLRGGYIKDLSINPKGQLAGMTR